jgi:hypothetical protein
MDRYGLRVRENQEKAVAFVSPFPLLLSPRVRRDPTQMVYRLRMSPDDHPTGATALGHVHSNQQRASHRERAAAVLAPLLVRVEWLAFTSIILGTASAGLLH